MTRFPFLCIIPLFVALAGCMSDDTPQVFTPYLEDDFQAWKGPGPANIIGQAFYKLPSGRVLTCAGATISLLPAAGYNLEAMQSFGMGKGYPENYNKSAMRFVRKTTCDSAGHFTFQSLPANNWIIMTHLSWQETRPLLAFTKADEGGTLFQEALLAPGDNKIFLSNEDFTADSSGFFPF
jgi:hypothetical protein